MQQYSIEVIFGLNLVLSFISLILAIFMKVPFETIARTAEDKGFKVSDFIAKEAIPIAIIVFIAGLSYSSILNYIKVFAQERLNYSFKLFFRCLCNRLNFFKTSLW